ncbi:hypothetical protein [Streptomyces sp. NPDC006551]|uniref:hypothetical protein n=1 Tax=Streptomyces sp. NPDC006551 TaxID=3157178 RepID=UPI0033B2EBE2
MVSDEVDRVGTAVLLAAAPTGRGRAIDAASVLPALAAVPPSALTGTPAATVVELADPLDPQTVLTRLRAAAAMPGPMAVYLAGQVHLDRRQHLPHLALARTTSTTLRYTGLPWHWLAAELAVRGPGTTTVVADLVVEAELWQRLTATPGLLSLGPGPLLYGRVAPAPRRGEPATPEYLRTFATIWRTGARPPLAQLHEEAAARTEGTEALLLAPTATPPHAVAPAGDGVWGTTATTSVAPGGGPTGPGGGAPTGSLSVAPGGIAVATGALPGSPVATGALPVPAGPLPAPIASLPGAPIRPAPTVPEQTVPASALPTGTGPSGPEATAVAPGAWPPPVGPPGPVTPATSPAGASAPSVPSVPSVAAAPPTAPAAPAPTEAGRSGRTGPATQAGASGRVAATGPAAPPVPPGTWGPSGQGGAAIGPAGNPSLAPATASDATAHHTEPAPAESPSSGSPRGTGGQGGAPAVVPAHDPHREILAAAQAGRHGEAIAVAAAWEREALRRYGARSQEAVHWMEVRADLARLAGEPARSCELWIAAAQARLGLRQGPGDPDVEGAVDRAHHQWEQIQDPARARELGPALIALRRQVPGRQAGALAALQRRMR